MGKSVVQQNGHLARHFIAQGPQATHLLLIGEARRMDRGVGSREMTGHMFPGLSSQLLSSFAYRKFLLNLENAHTAGYIIVLQARGIMHTLRFCGNKGSLMQLFIEKTNMI